MEEFKPISTPLVPHSPLAKGEECCKRICHLHPGGNHDDVACRRGVMTWRADVAVKVTC